ncbi:DegT/DnrJ/EryC1/StrS family aminotransferase [Candidatus Oleimmundimicrobium sp.]|uniref:DegT/DnrJ/EryC1/StrS family aminotransferase n=1 Tax=Candidatus Oleimmundimicrobium sp. TaxID=3060597 RepID=UPI0027213CD4|nr:DegT/DnrJ/EryC1/StrS family aminotransferase [Candidatus Oleimmundimicrobium sp.]MDO8885567.1 DegT/DnrJ/EryC1/StrS family aminotransferase [Candidatus Oleimmundimicrobium sp.]
MSIPLLDLQAQYCSIKNEIDAAVMEVMGSCRFILGSKVQELEEKVAVFCGAKYGVGVANGTDALILSLEAMGIGPGDEVITTPFTFFATAECISRVGAKPVFVDIEPNTFNLNIELIEEKINENTKAIIPVHIFGQPVDMDAIMTLAKKHNLKVVEDACQAIGAEFKGKRIGGLGDTGCFSFFPSKNLGCAGDGGMVVTNDKDLAERIRLLRQHGSPKKYHHTILGHNSRLDALQAAILLVKLKYLDSWNDKRGENAYIYNELLKDIDVVTPFEADNVKHIYHLYIIRTKKRDELEKALKEAGIGTGVYYPVPLHLQEVYADLGYKWGDLPESDKASKETIAIPLYAELKKEQIESVVKVIKKVL